MTFYYFPVSFQGIFYINAPHFKISDLFKSRLISSDQRLVQNDNALYNNNRTAEPLKIHVAMAHLFTLTA